MYEDSIRCCRSNPISAAWYTLRTTLSVSAAVICVGRRLVSIVARLYSYAALPQYFSSSPLRIGGSVFSSVISSASIMKFITSTSLSESFEMTSFAKSFEMIFFSESFGVSILWISWISSKRIIDSS